MDLVTEERKAVMKRSWLTMFVIALGVIALAIWSGCGGDDEGETTSVTQDDDSTEAATTSGHTGNQSDFEERLSDLENLEATVEVIKDG